MLAAAARCIERWSVSKVTLSDIAAEAGVSRATLYRTFPGGRDELLASLVQHEMLTFFGRLAEHTRSSGDVAGLLTDGLMYANQMLVEHSLYQRVMASEPELILPLMTVESSRIRGLIGAHLRPWVEAAGVTGETRLDELCDYLSRMVLSFIETPGSWDMADADSVGALVRSRFLAAVEHAAGEGAPGPTEPPSP
ncbi:MAG: TetR/AcrR family transcriptional regulator [Actinomycetota bacterium]|nr:TetR/AcrR family transcriptional regulator [Actinomycetota bacterium]